MVPVGGQVALVFAYRAQAARSRPSRATARRRSEPLGGRRPVSCRMARCEARKDARIALPIDDAVAAAVAASSSSLWTRISTVRRVIRTRVSMARSGAGRRLAGDLAATAASAITAALSAVAAILVNMSAAWRKAPRIADARKR